jgi:hypothetical protein
VGTHLPVTFSMQLWSHFSVGRYQNLRTFKSMIEKPVYTMRTLQMPRLLIFLVQYKWHAIVVMVLLGVVAHAYNLSTWEAEARRS